MKYLRLFEENNRLLMCVDTGRLKSIEKIGVKIYKPGWHHDCGWYLKNIETNKIIHAEPYPYKYGFNAPEWHHTWGAIFTTDDSIEAYQLRKGAEKYNL